MVNVSEGLIDIFVPCSYTLTNDNREMSDTIDEYSDVWID